MPAQLEVFGFVDHTHPAATELRENAIVRDGLADHFACVPVRRRTSSKKFSRNVSWTVPFASFCVEVGISAANRAPSGARSRCASFGVGAKSCLSDQSRGFSARNESPLAL